MSTTPALERTTRKLRSSLPALSAKVLGKRKLEITESIDDDGLDSDGSFQISKPDVSRDAALAAALQDDEYQEFDTKRTRLSDSLDDSDLSSIESIYIPDEMTKTSNRKGKGRAPEVDTTHDKEIAHALQAREVKSSSTKRAIVIESDDESELSSVQSVEMISERKVNLKSKSNMTAASSSKQQTARGNRTASANARKAMAALDPTDQADFRFLDSEDDDDDEFVDEDDDSMDVDSVSAHADEDALDPVTLALRRYRDKRVKRAEANRRAAKYAHINDRWERKRAMNRDRLVDAHPKLKTMWTDLEKIPVIKPVQALQPTSINRTLKSFQLEGLDWMVKQEQTGYKGGLLGDEMGMGKTIQAVSLIMSDYPAKDPTLVVVPPVALMQWSNEIGEYTDGKLKVLVFHGTNSKTKNIKVKDLKKYDVIMVSYNSLESLYRREIKGWTRGDEIHKEKSPIHAIHFHRLILDEAHSIKSRNTGVAKACFALKGTYKWCLSGTPVQNRIGEFFSLLRFLEVRPFADYFCRSCDCEQIHWSLDDEHKCPHCGHGGSEHISIFNQELLNPITGDDPELKEDALDKLHLITARVMLRRMKRDNTSAMELPPKEVIIHNEFFSEIERDFSTSIMTNTTRQFDTYVSRGVMLNNYANIFGLIMQMRQVANHPDLLLKKNAEGSQNVIVCNICDEVAEEAIRSRCHHEFCRACVKNYVKTCEGSGEKADCPRCHIPLEIDFDQPEIEQDEEVVKKNSIINRIKMENWTSSTKIEMLIYDLYKLRSKKQTLKSIVFSQFTSMLQLIEWRLRRAGFNTVMLDGSMTPAQRQKSIEYFMNNTEVEVFLVSLKAGGVALNLTEASRVFIVDPWWNPAAEWQSADRCHRIGQRRPCVITRLCIEDSVESRMVLLQEKKAAMIAGTVNNDKVAMDKLSPEDLQFLFRGT
jgi:DNA repair protein RAD16